MALSSHIIPAERYPCEAVYRHSRETLVDTERHEGDRQNRMQRLLLQHDAENLRNDLRVANEEQTYLKTNADDWRLNAHQACEKAERASAELMKRMKELRALQVQMSSVQEESQDSAQALAEKLTLARELAQLRPELEDLRTRHRRNENLLTEKFELQRELDILRAELQTEKTAARRHDTRREKLEAANLRQASEIEELHTQLQEAHQHATKAASDTIDTKKTIELEKRLAQVEKEKRAAAKDAVKATSEWHAEKEVLEEKLENARDKIKGLKEKLKMAQAVASEAMNQESGRAFDIQQASKNSRKRSAVQFNHEATLGTPGDEANNKRSKRAGSVLGEKSSFSITPFLNRTLSIAPADSADTAPIASIEEESQTQVRKPPQQAMEPKRQALAVAFPGKANLKVKPSIKPAKPSKLTLATVAEEIRDGEPAERINGIDMHLDGGAKKPQLKLKTIARELTREASVQPLPKKQRKLHVNRTIFDDEDEQGEAAGLTNLGKGFGSQRAFGALTARSLGAFGASSNKRRGLMVVKPDGFMFSPLKKDRRAAAALHAVPAA